MSFRKLPSHFSDNTSLVRYILDNVNIHLSFSKFGNQRRISASRPPIHVTGETVSFSNLSCVHSNMLLCLRESWTNSEKRYPTVSELSIFMNQVKPWLTYGTKKWQRGDCSMNTQKNTTPSVIDPVCGMALSTFAPRAVAKPLRQILKIFWTPNLKNARASGVVIWIGCRRPPAVRRRNVTEKEFLCPWTVK